MSVRWVECKRCGRKKREDSYCECATPEEIAETEALLRGESEAVERAMAKFHKRQEELKAEGKHAEG